MQKRWLFGLVYAILIFFGLLFAYSFSELIDYKSYSSFIKNITLVMLFLAIIGLSLIFYFFSKEKSSSSKINLSGLSKRKVYSVGGDYIGIVKDILIEGNKIYGLKVLRPSSFKGQRKILISFQLVRSCGDVILVDFVFD